MKIGKILIVIGIVIMVLTTLLFSCLTKTQYSIPDCETEQECFQLGEGIASLRTIQMKYCFFGYLVGLILLIIGITLWIKNKRKRK